MDLNLNTVIYYILVIDNDSDEHYFLRTALNRVIPQAIIESVYCKEEIIHYFKTSTLIPNLILLDQKMAKEGANDTIKILKQNELFRKVPIVVYTDSEDVKEKAEIFKLGVSGFYSKPHQIDDLISMVIDVKDKFLQ